MQYFTLFWGFHELLGLYNEWNIIVRLRKLNYYHAKWTLLLSVRTCNVHTKHSWIFNFCEVLDPLTLVNVEGILCLILSTFYILLCLLDRGLGPPYVAARGGEVTHNRNTTWQVQIVSWVTVMFGTCWDILPIRINASFVRSELMFGGGPDCIP